MDMPLNTRFAATTTTAMALGLALFPIWIPLLRKFGIMDQPNARKIHKIPIPRMGGIVIFAAFAIPIWLFSLADVDKWHGILLGSGIALAIGCADDLWGVPATIKLVSLCGLTLLIWRFGVITELPLCPFSTPYCSEINTALNLVVTMLWISGVCSAMNALDHMDGLAAGVSIVAASAYLAVSMQTKQEEWAIVSLALIGSLIAFLVFNKPPAKVFMGDSGSFFLGFALASIGIMGGWSSDPIKAGVIPIAILSMPIFDLCHVLVFRQINGVTHTIREAIVYCGKDHIGHRLLALGFSKGAALDMACFISATIAISALVIRHANYLESALLLIQIIMIYLILAVLMEKTRRVKIKKRRAVKPDAEKPFSLDR